jgi:flavin-dependent dehydrogenase
MTKKQWYTIKEGMVYCGIKEFYMRRLVREERIPTKHVQINKKGGFKHLIDVKELDKYLATKGRKSDGKRAFIFRADDAKYNEIKKVLEELDTESAPRYKRKTK